jgi:cytochrome c-type biogenesis protein CcmE
MKVQRKRRLYAIAAIALASSFAVALIAYALRQNINLYFTPTQVTQGSAPKNREFRMGGMVVKNSVQRQANTLQVNFVLTDYQNQIQVAFNGILPALFREGQGVVVQGKLNAQNILIANQVLAKHDEKYMPPKITLMKK